MTSSTIPPLLVKSLSAKTPKDAAKYMEALKKETKAKKEKKNANIQI